MRTRSSADTHTGLRRKRNEDAFLADDELGLYLVCDGVGGRACGEVASAEAADLIWEWMKREEPAMHALVAQRASVRDVIGATSVRPTLEPDDTAHQLGSILRSAVQNACYMVHSMGEIDPEQRGMSTTASVVQCVDEHIVVAQVGDSRVYLARDGRITQLTEDHTWQNFQVRSGHIKPEQARSGVGKHIITRAVGLREFVEVDILVAPVQPGDRLLLCSDGLHAYLDAGTVLADLFKLDLRAAAQAAIRHANACGGADNITALFVEFLAP